MLFLHLLLTTHVEFIIYSQLFSYFFFIFSSISTVVFTDIKLFAIAEKNTSNCFIFVARDFQSTNFQAILQFIYVRFSY